MIIKRNLLFWGKYGIQMTANLIGFVLQYGLFFSMGESADSGFWQSRCVSETGIRQMEEAEAKKEAFWILMPLEEGKIKILPDVYKRQVLIRSTGVKWRWQSVFITASKTFPG